nr:juxtaposed with another zinc finger protein 1 [Salvelinus alpinus]
MTDAARREQETLKKRATPKLSLSITGGVSRNSVATPPRHSNGNLTPPVTPPITPSSSFRSSTPTGSEYDDEEVDYEESDSDESWTTESAISSESILSSMCMNGGEEKPFACPVPGCKKRYKNVNGIKYHAKNGHRTQIRVRKPFKCRCGKSYKTSRGLRTHINFHPARLCRHHPQDAWARDDRRANPWSPPKHYLFLTSTTHPTQHPKPFNRQYPPHLSQPKTTLFLQAQHRGDNPNPYPFWPT